MSRMLWQKILLMHRYTMSKQSWRRMRRVCAGTPVHYQQIFREEHAAGVCGYTGTLPGPTAVASFLAAASAAVLACSFSCNSCSCCVCCVCVCSDCRWCCSCTSCDCRATV
jgi:hypothetical protein